MDINDPSSMAAAAEIAADVNLLINNAGSSTGADLLTSDFDKIRIEMDTHFFGTLTVIRTFVPNIASRG